MIFHEIYGCYYNAVAKIIGLAIDGTLTPKEMNRVVSEMAFEESVLSVIPAIRQQDWQLIDGMNRTPIVNKPAMPLTDLEKRWLKTVLLDPRVTLFDVPAVELNDVEPLYLPEDVVYFDRYLDGDPFEDAGYIANFRTVMRAIRECRKIKVHFYNNKGREREGVFGPIKMEYSDKEDKFRFLSFERGDFHTVNLGRIINCELLEEVVVNGPAVPARPMETLVFELTDERNALERAMMKFAHFEKRVERTGPALYYVEMEYSKEDETDVLIQILSFGSYVKVLAPEGIKRELADRLSRQLSVIEW